MRAAAALCLLAAATPAAAASSIRAGSWNVYYKALDDPA